MLREIVLGLVVSVGPQWLASACAQSPGDGGSQPRVIVRVVDGDNVEAAETGEVHAIAMVSVDTDADVAEQKQVHVVRVGGKPEIENVDDGERGWLGISMSDVPASLRAQLQTEEKGILVLNVVKDSPADRAGLQVHDLILSINGELIDGYKAAVDSIRMRKPGETVTLQIIRDGQEQTVRPTLSSRAKQSDTGFEWKFENVANAEIEDQVKTRGHIMLRGPHGQWTMKNLGNLEDLKGLPKDVLKFMPKSGSRTVQIQRDGDGQNIRVNVQRDGSTIVVHQSGDSIAVQRTDKDGNQTDAQYNSEDDLKAADNEAYELLRNAEGGSFNIQLDGDGFDWNGDIDVEAFEGNIEDWYTELEESMKNAHEAYDASMQEFHRLMNEMHRQVAVPGQPGAGPQALFQGFSFGKPKQSFEVRADGSIEVKIRKGDSEVVRLYQNEADLKRRNPDLFEKYQDVLDAEE